MEIDPATGEVQVVAYASVNDVGRVINPMIVRGQLDGGAVQGMRFIERILRAPSQLNIGRRNRFLVRIQPGFRRDKRQRLLTSLVLNSRHVVPAGEQQVFVQIRMAEVDTVKLAVEFGQIVPQREAP